MSQARSPALAGAAALAQRSGPAHRVSPVGVVGLLPQRPLQVEALGVVGGLGARVADVALRVEPLGGLHGVLRAHSCQRRKLSAKTPGAQAGRSGSWEASALVCGPSPRPSSPSGAGAGDRRSPRDTAGPLPGGSHPFLSARWPVLPGHEALRKEQRPHLPRAELATRSISTVFRASGRCLAFSFLLVASTWGGAGVRAGGQALGWAREEPPRV